MSTRCSLYCGRFGHIYYDQMDGRYYWDLDEYRRWYRGKGWKQTIMELSATDAKTLSRQIEALEALAGDPS